jgi:hypothetical protein
MEGQAEGGLPQPERLRRVHGLLLLSHRRRHARHDAARPAHLQGLHACARACATHVSLLSLTNSLPYSPTHYLTHQLTTLLTNSLPYSPTHYLTHQLTTLLTNSLPYSLALLTHSRSGAGASRRLSLRRCSSPPAPPSSASPSSARRSSLGSRTVGPCTFSGLATPSYLLGCAGLHTHALRCLAPPASHRSRPLLRRWAPRPSCSPSSSARRRASNPTPTPTPTPTLTLT